MGATRYNRHVLPGPSTLLEHVPINSNAIPRTHNLQIVAVLAVRNEQDHLANSLRHLKANGIFYAILDNGSTDSSRAIIEQDEFRSHLVAIGDIPFGGVFDLTRQLDEKMKLINRLDADWVIHLDADEILQSYRDGESLHDAIARAEAAGFNAIDFNEFVFLPVLSSHEGDIHGPQRILTYYFFEPSAPRLMRAWKKSTKVEIAGGGHQLVGDGIRLSPEKMAMRHYIFRDQDHAFAKYTGRRFSPFDLARGMHSNRFGQIAESFRFPAVERLCRLANPQSRDFDRSRPTTRHFWQWERQN
jgi:glycosyltransferase involved in cell wall biosynthesis